MAGGWDAAMLSNSYISLSRLSRREFLGVAGGGLVASRHVTGNGAEESTAADPNCPQCGGLGRVPLKDAKPFVWISGTPLPKPEPAAGEQFCPACQSSADASVLAAEKKEQIEAALEKQKKWQERTGFKLVSVVTRHATVHTQYTPAHARSVGQAMESLTLHLKKVTGTLQLATTRPDTLELMLLSDKSAWEQFRKAMEGLYTPIQLGESWATARQYNAYDHFVTPHMYETTQSIRSRPPACGIVFMVARRQLSLATNWQTPFWLAEGFAAYGDYVVHKVNRWFTVYQVKQVPVGDWMAEARKLAAEARHRTWKEMLKRELREWEAADHVQTMAMAGFLLESEPAKFLDLLKRLKAGDQEVAALEDAYRVTLDELEQRWVRWMLARR
jgi:hypothetical protein